jgi:hypothetical protein
MMKVPEHMSKMFESKPIKKPNFFILGAGRCGSTSLYSMLSQHPGIFMPKLKEPSFFCSYFQVIKDPISYFKLFNFADENSAVGEASHVYFSNPESASIIRSLFPDAKFILIFRNPTERAYSLYNWARSAKLEPLDLFENALNAEEVRFADKNFFNNCPHYFWNFMYVRSSFFNIQWKRYLNFFPRKQFFPIGLNELRFDPLFWMQSIYKFLGVDEGFEPETAHLNNIKYTPLSKETKQKLDDVFCDVITETNLIAGRDMQLEETIT